MLREYKYTVTLHAMHYNAVLRHTNIQTEVLIGVFTLHPIAAHNTSCEYSNKNCVFEFIALDGMCTNAPISDK